ncbi:hypothetical protein VTJ49DRAFT_5543 [Mycothermus thermophilus]|uniref:F-box domain-containing protein n=1 Tax=Humicola insolens TaxID=85995 RepID=A0ABR3V3G3_HUMIN
MTRPPSPSQPTPTPTSAPSSHLLHALPTELLLFVINNLTRVQDVASLARTSRRLYSMCNPYLYRRAAETNDARPLAWAANRGLVSTLKLALAAGLDPNYEFVEDISYQEWTAVATAAREAAAAGREKQPWGMWEFNNRPEPFQDATSSKARPPQQTSAPVSVPPPVGKRRFYAIHLAARSGHLDVLDLLLRHNAAVDVRSIRFCACTPQRGLLNHLEYPEDDEAQYEEEDLTAQATPPGPGPAPGWWTPLHVAICHGQTDAARLLLGKGKATPLLETHADGVVATQSVDSPRLICYGASALHHAAAFGLTDLVTHLLDSKIITDVDIRDNHSLTPFYHAYACRRWDTTVPLLLARGADINHAATMYIPYTAITALGEACRLGDFSVADRLISLGADVRKGCLTYTKPGCLTPLHLCCMRSAVAPPNTTTTPNLPPQPNNPYLKNGEADTPARGEARMRTISKLIAHGAPLDARDCFGSTPLMAAVQARNSWAIEALRRHGAGPEDADPKDMEAARARLGEGEGST